ncbi:MAG: MFS transporter [Bacteroidales bacterium]|nr:MFS transporter [Bacteroidales bacterium]
MKSIRAFYPLMVISGLVQLLIPSTIHIIMDQFHLTEGEVSTLPLVYFIGMMVSAVFVTHLINRFLVKLLLLTSALLICISLISASLSYEFYMFTFFCFFTGLGNGILIILPGVYVTNVLSKESARIQSTLFGFISFGYILGPLIPGIIIKLDISWRWAIASPALLMVPLIIPLIFTKFNRIEKVDKLSVSTVKEIIKFNPRFFTGLFIALILGAGATQGFLIWIITFLEKERGLLQGSAHLILSAIGICLVFGRLACGNLTKRFSTFNILIIISIVSTFLIFFAPFPQHVIFNIVLFMLASIFFAGIFPLLLSAASTYPKSESSSTYSLFFIALALGSLFVPFLIGHIFEIAGYVAGMSSITVLFLGVLACLFFIKNDLPNKRKSSLMNHSC